MADFFSLPEETRQQYILDNLEKAFKRGEIKAYYQPVIRAMPQKLCSMEALARWESEEYGTISPAAFISVLEQAGKIHLLDLYIVEQVCKLNQQLPYHGIPLIPVSVNFSRLDFELCDIVNEVEAIVEKYHALREYIHIEITESVFATSEHIKQSVELFRKKGYYIWMDDFGSGYSSLNILKSFYFDTIKLDMEFLRDFSKSSKAIIASVVSMAKKLGIITLSEGVETKEQLDYLKNIGCDLIQGYYFSKPMPFADMLKNLKANGIEVETPMEAAYYDKIDRIDVLSSDPFVNAKSEATSHALAIVEFCNGEWRYLYKNETFKSLRFDFFPLGTEENDMPVKITNDDHRPIANRLRDAFYRAVKTGGETFNRVIGGDYYNVHTKVISSMGETYSIMLDAYNLSSNEFIDNQTELDNLLRHMYSMYDSIAVYDCANNRYRSLYINSDTDSHYDKELPDLDMAVKRFANERIFRDDRDRFLAESDIKTLFDRVNNSYNGYKTFMYRTLDQTRGYVWKLYIYKALMDGKLLVMYRYANQSYANKWYGFNSENENEYGMTDAMLWHSLISSLKAGVFWKDKECRYIGINHGFAKYFGFDSSADILGRTDEDMGWYIDHEPFKRDDTEVLQNGNTINNRQGTLIVKGEERSFVVTKSPIYNGGDIVGLIGIFRETDNADTVNHKVIDSVTGLINSHGLFDELSNYHDSFINGLKDFTEIFVGIDNYHTFAESYGAEFCNELLRKVASMLVDMYGNKCIIARYGGGEFALVRQTDSDEVIDEMYGCLRTALNRTMTIQGRNVTVYVCLGHAKFSEYNSVNAMNSHARNEMHAEYRDGILKTTLKYNELLKNNIHFTPCGSFMFAFDGEHQLEYASDDIIKTLGYKDMDEIEEKLGVGFYDTVYDEDRDRVKRLIRDQLSAGDQYYVDYRVKNAKGEPVWLYTRGRLVKDGGGNSMYYVVASVTNDIKMRAMEERWRMFRYKELSSIPGVSVFDYNLKSDRLEVHVTDSNGRTSAIIEKPFIKNIDGIKWISTDGKDKLKAAFEYIVSNASESSLTVDLNLAGGGFDTYKAHIKSVNDDNGVCYHAVGKFIKDNNYSK